MATKDIKKQAAIEAFKNNAAIDDVMVTHDVKVFTVISDAQNYVKKKFEEEPENQKLEEFTRQDLKVIAKVKHAQKPSDIVAQIKAAKSSEEVQAHVAHEYRPFVLEQAKRKMKELGVDQKTVTSKTLENTVLQLTQKNAELSQKLIEAEKGNVGTGSEEADKAKGSK